MKRAEKFTYAGCPWFFGVVCLLTGLALTGKADAGVERGIFICGAFVCMSLFGISALLIKLVEQGEAEEKQAETRQPAGRG